jgi:hypothetical protein
LIQLGEEILLLQLPSGEMVPCSVHSLSVEIQQQSPWIMEADVLESMVIAIWHYFKKDLRRKSVLMSEFVAALRRVVWGLGLSQSATPPEGSVVQVCECDLNEWVSQVDMPMELDLYPRLRREVKSRLATAPRLLRIRGLKSVAKHYAGSPRWNARCRKVQDQILAYLRDCLRCEGGSETCPMVVE